MQSRFSAAQVIYGLGAFAFALLLFSQLESQAKYFDKLVLAKQPGLWPVISIVGMLVFGTLQLIQYWLHRATLTGAGFSSEAAVWVKALEYVFWFMLYVYLVPVTGYLPTTLLLCAVLTVRLGYRTRRMMLAALVTAFVIVLVFKSFLQVKIPGGLVYEYLPATTRNFMILYF